MGPKLIGRRRQIRSKSPSALLYDENCDAVFSDADSELRDAPVL